MTRNHLKGKKMKKIVLTSLIVSMSIGAAQAATELATTNYVKTGVQTRIKKIDKAVGGKLTTSKADGTIEESKVAVSDLATTASIADMETKTNAAATYASKATETVASGAATDAAAASAAATAAKTAADASAATIATYGDIVTHKVAEFATKAQGDKADATDSSLTSNNTIAKANSALQAADIALKMDKTAINGTNGYAAVYTGTAGTMSEMQIVDTWIE
jgi:hypothetical protein